MGSPQDSGPGQFRDRRFEALAPIDAPAVDIDDWIDDPARVVEIVDGSAARLDAAVVVDDDEPAGRHLVIEGGQRIRRQFIHVAVEAQHREPLDRRGAQRVLEPALEEDDAVVQEPVFGEIRFHLVERNRELLDRVVFVPEVGGIGLCVGSRKPLEQIGDEHAPPEIPEGLERRAHQDAAAPPYARFDEIAGHPFADRGCDQVAQVPEPRGPDHRVGALRPIASEFPQRRVERPFHPGQAHARVAVAVDGVGQTPLDEIEIERRRLRLEGRGGFRVNFGVGHAPEARAAPLCWQGGPPGAMMVKHFGAAGGLQRSHAATWREI